LVNRIKSASAREVNRLLKRSGAIWDVGFHDRALRRDEDVKVVARYIIANPIRAGLVKQVGDYPLWNVIWL
jgi:REP element-mobilizing transposase RayT